MPSTVRTKRRRCRYCKQQRRFERHDANKEAIAMHAVCCVITLGLWFPVFLIWSFADSQRPYRCTECGKASPRWW